MIIEDDSSKKYDCPLSKNSRFPSRCSGSDCMGWVWVTETIQVEHPEGKQWERVKTQRGYCGMVPE